MEPVVYEESPLADYLKDGGGSGDSEPEWAPMLEASGRNSLSSESTSPPASPTPFAPTGRPIVNTRLRNHAPSALRIDTSSHYSLESFRKSCSAAVAASIDRADNAKFLEQFRYIIVASQLLSEQSFLGQHRGQSQNAGAERTESSSQLTTSTEGILGTVFGALAVSTVLSWILGKEPPQLTRRRVAFVLVLAITSTFIGRVYLRRQWLRYRRQQALAEINSFVLHSHEIDSIVGAALGLIQEVELVSRGYRLSHPLPPISRMEDRTQSRKCVRIRKSVRKTTLDVLGKYRQVMHVVKGFSEALSLEKYYDIYDISDFDIEDALTETTDDGDESESLRSLKILAARFHVVRKLILCALLALEANGESSDLLRWTAAVESLRTLNQSTHNGCEVMRALLREEESFPVPGTPRVPLTPNRERWRSQLRKLDSLSTGIRGLQAKLQLMREESDRTLDNSQSLAELGPSLVLQYEAIGVDLKELMAAWEEGKAALAQGIDRNEKRLSSMSTLISPTTSLSGLTTVDEYGSADDAFKALTSGSPVCSDASSEEAQEVFEAVSMPRARPRSTLTREERIIKMREEREQKAQARQQVDATRGMLRELETVINLRPKPKVKRATNGRIMSL